MAKAVNDAQDEIEYAEYAEGAGGASSPWSLDSYVPDDVRSKISDMYPDDPF